MTLGLGRQHPWPGRRHGYRWRHPSQNPTLLICCVRERDKMRCVFCQTYTSIMHTFVPPPVPSPVQHPAPSGRPMIIFGNLQCKLLIRSLKWWAIGHKARFVGVWLSNTSTCMITRWYVSTLWCSCPKDKLFNAYWKAIYIYYILVYT